MPKAISDINASEMAPRWGCLWHMNRILQLAGDQFDAGPDAAGLTMRQAYVLSAIGDNGKSTQRSVCVSTGIDRSTLSELLRRLVKKGLIKSRRSLSDRRAVKLHLTEEGRIVRRLGEKAILATEDRLMATMSAEQRQRLADDLSALLSDVEVR